MFDRKQYHQMRLLTGETKGNISKEKKIRKWLRKVFYIA
jgi:hypothetical protein